MKELMELIQTPAGVAVAVFGGIVALMILARLVFFGTFFLAIPVVAAVGGLRSGMRRLAAQFHSDNEDKAPATQISATMPREAGVPAGEEREASSMVGGFRMPRNLWYHPKHFWMKQEPYGKVRIGFDDFARRLMGNITRIDMLTFNVQSPGKRASRSFLKGWVIYCDGKTVRIISPIRGRIEVINDRLGREPSIIAKDPYGDGWLCTLVPEGDANPLDKTISGMHIDRWMRDEVHRLRHCIRDHGLTVLHDGGEIAQDLASTISASDWRQLVKSFLSD
ncbi:MAG: glycine cleavage system protein H [Deltaproteobacteria bacterium]|nr:glycine cleavage system protein H [Deltaproteobacteria bacterium]MBW2308966.1 glycine cleavage system protein H [Deltaproteobacteria bacterium]